MGSDGITLGESFCAITDEEILKMSKASNLKQSSLQCNDTLSTSLLHTVKASCKNVPYSDEADTEARTKLFGLWTCFGPLCVFFTISPADECSFRVSLFCNTSKQNLPDVNASEDQCIANMLFQAKERTEILGACAREFNSLIVMEILIGWNSKKREQTRKGIFGQVMAWGDTTEEQGWFTLHSHILLWIVNFDHLVTMLWSNKEDIREKAKTELLKYFENIMCSTYDIREEEFVHKKFSKKTSECIRQSGDVPVKDSCCTDLCENKKSEENIENELCWINPVMYDQQYLRNMR